MLKALYKHRYLRGKVLALISGNSEQKGYDRIAALKKQGLVASETLVKQQRCGSRVINKKVASIYYLTTKGTVAVKILLGLDDLTGEERGRKPTESEMERAYRVSLLLEGLIELYEGFESPAEYKAQQGLPNFVPVNLIYGENLIFFEKTNSNIRHRVVAECHAMQERLGGIRTIILTEGESQRANLVSYCIQNYGQNELVLPEYDFAGIRYLLTPEQSLKNYFLNNFDFEELDQPIDGYKYMVNGELTNIFDIVGMPPRVLRRVKRASSPKYLLVSSPKEKNLFYRHYPEHKEDPDTIVYVLSEILKANPDAMSPAKEQTHDKWARIFQNYVQRMGGEDYQP